MISKRGRLLPGTAIFLLSQAARALDAARTGAAWCTVTSSRATCWRSGATTTPTPTTCTWRTSGSRSRPSSIAGPTTTGAFLGTIEDYIQHPRADPRPLRARHGRPVLPRLRALRMPDRPGAVREGPRHGDHRGPCSRSRRPRSPCSVPICRLPSTRCSPGFWPNSRATGTRTAASSWGRHGRRSASPTPPAAATPPGGFFAAGTSPGPAGGRLPGGRARSARRARRADRPAGHDHHRRAAPRAAA